MATSPKRSPAHPAKGAEPPFLRFQLPHELQDRTLSVLDSLEQAEDATGHRDALAELVVALTNCGMDSYFLQPLRKAEAGFLVQKSADLGLAGAQKVMGSVIRNIVGRMDGPQLRSICGSIRQFMR
jgi:hypothetical protein